MEGASVLAKQYHQVVLTVLDHLEWPPERRAEMTQMIGAVLPLALAHHDGGARKARKAAGPLQFIRETCEDALEEGPFYDTEGHAIDLPTELHRTPPPRALQEGGRGVVKHFEGLVLNDYFKLGGATVSFVAVCNDISALVTPIKAHEQSARTSNTGGSSVEWDAASESPLPGGTGWQSLLRASGNRSRIAASLRRHFERPEASKDGRYNSTLIFYGMDDLTPGDGSGVAQIGDTPAEESNDEPVPNRQDLWLWPGDEGSYRTTGGPRVGEGELSTTHFVIWHHKFNGGHRLRKWTIT